MDNTPEHVQADAVGQMNHPTDDETWEDVEADDIPTISAPKGADMLTALATIKGSIVLDLQINFTFTRRIIPLDIYWRFILDASGFQIL